MLDMPLSAPYILKTVRGLQLRVLLFPCQRHADSRRVDPLRSIVDTTR